MEETAVKALSGRLSDRFAVCTDSACPCSTVDSSVARLFFWWRIRASDIARLLSEKRLLVVDSSQASVGLALALLGFPASMPATWSLSMTLFFCRKAVGFWPMAWLGERVVREGGVPHLHGEDRLFLEHVFLVRLELEEPGGFYEGVALALLQVFFGEEAGVFVLHGELVAETQHREELCVLV